MTLSDNELAWLAQREAELIAQGYTWQAAEAQALKEHSTILLHKLYRILSHIQVRPFKWGKDQLDALSIVIQIAEDVNGGYYQHREWAQTNLQRSMTP